MVALELNYMQFQGLENKCLCSTGITRLTPAITQGKESLNVSSDGFYYVYFDVSQFTLILKYFFSFLTIYTKAFYG